MSTYYGNIRTSNTYGQFYNDPWSPSTLVNNPNIIKNRLPVRPGRTNEDYGDFYQDPKLRPNIRNYLGGYWGRPSAVKDTGEPHPLPRDWSKEREVMRSYPGAVPAGVPSFQDGRSPVPPDPRRSAYDSPRRSHEQPLQQGQPTSHHSQRPQVPKWDLRVDPWKSEYRRHYKNDRAGRLPDIRQLDQLTMRRGLGDGGMAYADEYPRAPPGYLQ